MWTSIAVIVGAFALVVYVFRLVYKSGEVGQKYEALKAANKGIKRAQKKHAVIDAAIGDKLVGDRRSLRNYFRRKYLRKTK